MSDEEKKQTWEVCEVGMFRLPGIAYEQGALTTEEFEERVDWCLTNHCGRAMTERLFCFKTTAQRDWFILRWS